MRIFAISDLHYSGLPPTKPMEIFHPMWENHRANIRQAWLEMITPDDTILIGGDTSWAMKWDDAKEDLDELVSLPGRKILIRGNHDYWWQTQARMTKVYGESLTFLQANALLLSNGTGIAGTRGWKVPGDPYFTEEDQPILERELERLKRALEALTELPANRRILLIHYPPVFSENQPSPLSELIAKYPVDLCIYGHLHGENVAALAPKKTPEGLPCILTSCDALNFKPLQIIPRVEAE